MKKIALSILFVCCASIVFPQTIERDTILPFRLVKDPSGSKTQLIIADNTDISFQVKKKRDVDLAKKAMNKGFSLTVNFKV